jgi:protein arginine N-methyltransferase 5
VLASDWLELDSPDEGIRFDSELVNSATSEGRPGCCAIIDGLHPLQALRQELLTCQHLHIRTLVIPPPLPENRDYLPSYARAIASLLELGGEAAVTRIAIRIGVSDRPNLASHNQAPSQNNGSNHNSYIAAYTTPSPAEDKKHKRKSSMGIGLRMSASHGLLPTSQQVGNGPSIVSNRQSMIIGSGDQNSFSWEVWDCVRNVCDYHPRLGLGE